MTRRLGLMLGMSACLLTAVVAAPPPADSPIKVTLRTRVEPFKGTDTWEEVSLKAEIDPKTTAPSFCAIYGIDIGARTPRSAAMSWPARRRRSWIVCAAAAC